jgi:hypothetical protein
MRRFGPSLGLTLLIAFACLPVMAVTGVFQGRLLQPDGWDAGSGWMFVQSPNKSVRRVEIRTAHLRYSDEIPKHARKKELADGLRDADQVRVTANQRSDGEWSAQVVEILTLQPEPDRPGTTLAVLQPVP